MNKYGRVDWAFFDKSEQLMIVTTDGEKIASTSGNPKLDGFVMTTDSAGNGLLITLHSGKLHAQRAEFAVIAE
jgi:hypothetical protein